MNLVIQRSLPLTATQRETLHSLAGATSVVDIAPEAVRFGGCPLAHRDRVAAFCAQQSLDFAYLPAQRLADFGLLAMDMDSTLITIECIDEIADFCGVKPQVAAITEAAMRGEISDFAESLRRRVALLAGLDANILQRVYDARVRLSPGVETLLAGARAAGLATLLVSGGFTFFTERLQARLGIDEAHANTLEVVDGKLTGRVVGAIVDGAAKARFVADACRRLGIATAQAIVVGDGSNDLPMMSLAGLSVAYRAKPVVRAGATLALDHVGLDGLLRVFV